MPKTWDDLCNENLKGKIAYASPAKSGSAYTQLCTMLFSKPTIDEGWELAFNFLKNLDGKVQDSSGNCHKLVAAGEYAVGVTIEKSAVLYKGRGGELSRRDKRGWPGPPLDAPHSWETGRRGRRPLHNERPTRRGGPLRPPAGDALCDVQAGRHGGRPLRKGRGRGALCAPAGGHRPPLRCPNYLDKPQFVVPSFYRKIRPA